MVDDHISLVVCMYVLGRVTNIRAILIFDTSYDSGGKYKDVNITVVASGYAVA